MPLPNVDLLPKENLVRTSDVDHADWNYRPFLGYLQRTRFRLIASLLNRPSFESILEIGYGSGVFFPYLSGICENLSGIDIHEFPKEVQLAVEAFGISATLESGDVANMPFASDQFDCAVAVSALEYVDAIDDACNEIKRVLKDDGTLVIVTPAQSPLLDAALRIVGGEDAEENYGDRRGRLESALLNHFSVLDRRDWPRILPGLTVYKAICLAPRT